MLIISEIRWVGIKKSSYVYSNKTNTIKPPIITLCNCICTKSSLGEVSRINKQKLADYIYFGVLRHPQELHNWSITNTEINKNSWHLINLYDSVLSPDTYSYLLWKLQGNYHKNITIETLSIDIFRLIRPFSGVK